eukprot:SAG22_NODE_6795_length_810_cov_1.369902_1_plen_29_part_10
MRDREEVTRLKKDVDSLAEEKENRMCNLG